MQNSQRAWRWDLKTRASTPPHMQAKPEVLVLDVKEVEHPQHTAMVLDRAMRTRDMDNERFLRKVRARLDA